MLKAPQKFRLVLMVLVSLVWLQGRAQSEVRARQILAQVSKKYGAYNTIKSNFIYRIVSPQSGATSTVSGVLYSQPKANRYLIQTNTQDLISDGKLQWTYLKEEKEVQLNNADNSPRSFNPARIFTMYDKGFKSLYTGDEKLNGSTAHVIDLTPLDAQQSYFKVRLLIDSRSKDIKSAMIFDKNGNRYTYTVKTIVANPNLPAGFFTFNKAKHPGVEVVDLR